MSISPSTLKLLGERGISLSLDIYDGSQNRRSVQVTCSPFAVALARCTSCTPRMARVVRCLPVSFRKAYERTGLHTPGQMPHILRHTFASHDMMQVGNIVPLHRILGHGDIKMTMRHSHLAPDHFATALPHSPLALLQDASEGHPL